MRVSTLNRFNFFVGNMNSSLADLMELNLKASSQKNINRPSDDPVGMARVLEHRDTIASLEQFERNVDTAKGWLGLADAKLTRVNEILSRVRALAEQAATGTIGGDNREQISYEARQLYEEMIVLANTEYEGKYIFSGHKTDQQAFERSLWVTDNDGSVSGSDFSIAGDNERTALVQFTASGTVGTDAISYRYSLDGGKTFQTGNIPATPGDKTITLGGAQLTIPAGTSVSQVDTSQDTSNGNGTWLWLRATAEYKGDDDDTVTVDTFGPSNLGTSANGLFTQNVTVRMDNTTTLGGASVEYSYSLDGGATWVTGQTTDGSADPNNLTLVVPGGTVQLSDSGGGNAITEGDQFVVRPNTAAIYAEISPGEKVQINNIGKDIFGGTYQQPGDANPSLASGLSSSENLFDSIGRLVGYLETNNQQGIQEALGDFEPVSERIMDNAARIGGAENRLEVAQSVLDSMQLNEMERLSSVEDADITELMTQLSNQQIIYETVLRSSSMVMRMSLANFM